MASNGSKLWTGRCIHWFRKGLRLHDNPALLAAFKDSAEIYPIFILDPWFVANATVGINRWRFLMQCLQDLDEQFKALGSRLYVVRGKPMEVFPKLFDEWKISKLTFEEDTEPYALKRDQEVAQLAEKHGVTIEKHVSHTLYNLQSIIKKNGGNAPLTYQRCQTVISQLGPPAKPVESLSTVYPKDIKFNTDSDAKYNVPDLKELGVDEKELGPCFYPGGETEALRRLEKSLNRPQWIRAFEKPKTEPNSLEPSTTVLSPYLKFGCLSPRKFYWGLKLIYEGKKHSSPPVSLEGQLLWREFFYTAGYATPNFDKMEGNAVCRQIPWSRNSEFLKAWKYGKTGYPFIDAIMVQLRQEGWIHHLARHAVACFLTRGDLWCHWEEGQKVFEELLLDADWSLNAGNWMWLSASAFFHQYFRVYSPIAFGKKTDKSGSYIKKYLPVLKKFPVDYIYEPWRAPMGVQKAAGCIIGVDYPKPIVDHAIASKENMGRMKAAYDAAKQGSSKSAPKRKEKDSKESSPKKKRKVGKITDFIKKK